ncbi:hypothetical protein I4U23_029247 [Adineta vaga]|nr:hypothetical protein I4U23_029247 [Adineta vaga]
MTNRGKFSNNRRENRNFNRTKKKAPVEDDSLSIICFKDSDTGHVGTVRIRQQIFCTLCNVMRGTLSLYFKHVMDDHHHAQVKKLCDEKCFMPNVYDQAVHLGFHKNICYQTDKFHFRYKYVTEEVDSTAKEIKSSINENGSELKKMEVNTNTSKQKYIQVTLVFQDKTYSRTGTILAQIREQLLKDMLDDHAVDVAAIPIQFYYSKKKSTYDHIYDNNPNSSVNLTTAEEQSQVMRQQQQEPLKNGQKSSAECSGKDDDVTQTTVMTTHEISTAKIDDLNDQPSCDDDVMNVCKDVLNKILVDVYSKSEEYKREREFLFAIARRRCKKRKAFFCDICSVFLIAGDTCTTHQNGETHLEKLRHYQTEFLPWRRAMQESLMTGKSMKEIMGPSAYDNYKSTMALYLAPDSIHNHGRFCCAYCEQAFPDQWLLEQHLHTVEHQTKQTSTDHKELVPHFADMIILPSIYRLNGVNDLVEVPDDIKKEESWSSATRKQLDADTNIFLQNYPLGQFEGVTHITNAKTSRRHGTAPTSMVPTQKPWNKNAPPRNQQNKRGGFTRTERRQFQPTTSQRGKGAKRSFPVTPVPNKRFRQDLNNSFPGANRNTGSMRNYEMNEYNYVQPVHSNNGNDRWPSIYPSNQQQQPQQRQGYFQQRNFDTRPYPPNNNNGFYDNRAPQYMSGANNYDNDRQLRYNSDNGSGYGNQQSNYNASFNRSNTNPINEYRSDPASSALNVPSNHSHQRASTGSNNGFIPPIMNNYQRSQQPQQMTRSSMGQGQHSNPNSFNGFGVNNGNSTNPSFYSSSNNQQQNSLGTNTQPIHSYADYRASSVLPTMNSSSSMYTPVHNATNSMVSQNRSFMNDGRSTFGQNPTNSFAQPNGSSFNTQAPNFNTFGQQDQMESTSQAPWRSSSSGINNVRGRGQVRGGGGGGGSFHSTQKQSNSTFSYRNNNNNNSNSTLMRGRGTGRNARNFGSQR